MTTTPLSDSVIVSAPKVLLHDHLDGGLRPQTMIELAEEAGYRQLPYSDPDALAEWYVEACSSGSLERYLETFSHTIALMQTREQIIRVARECVIDLAQSGVVYAEVRGAPELFVEQGLTIPQVIEATLEGYQQGMSEAKAQGYRIRVESLLCGLRQNNRCLEVAHEVVHFAGRGVVGFDIAGPERGYPASQHLDAFRYLAEHGAHYTIHAGEAYGVESIADALRICGAQRIGHGIRLIDDISFSPDGAVLGELAREIHDRGIVLEMCPTSNLQTGGAPSMAEHQIAPMYQLGFKVTLNTDNRLMSQTSMVREAQQVVDAFGWGLTELETLATNAIQAAFLPQDERDDILNSQIRPEYARLRR